jgi:hypothetical protein
MGIVEGGVQLGPFGTAATLSTTNPIYCPDANTGRRGGKSAANRLSYGTALTTTKSYTVYYSR